MYLNPTKILKIYFHPFEFFKNHGNVNLIRNLKNPLLKENFKDFSHFMTQIHIKPPFLRQVALQSIIVCSTCEKPFSWLKAKHPREVWTKKFHRHHRINHTLLGRKALVYYLFFFSLPSTKRWEKLPLFIIMKIRGKEIF